MKKTRWAHGTMVLTTLLVATSFPVAASIAGAMESVVLTFLRFALASLLFLPLVVLRHRGEAIPTWRSLVRYFALSTPLVGFFLAMFEALRTTTAVNTSALFTFVPSFAAVFAFVFLGERISSRHLVALFAGTRLCTLFSIPPAAWLWAVSGLFFGSGLVSVWPMVL